MASKKQKKSLKVWIFASQMEAVENAVFLTGYYNDIDRTVVAASLFDGDEWKVGTELNTPEGGNLMRTFHVHSPDGRSKPFIMESYAEGYCLWILDETKDGVIHVLSHTMEDRDEWEDRNNELPDFPEDAAVLN